MGRATDPGVAAPGAATQHTHFAACLIDRIVSRRLSVIIVVIPILAPLIDIPVHIVQAKGIGWKTSHRHGALSVIPFLAVAKNSVAVVIGLVGRDGLSERESRLRSRPAGILPFRFGGQ